MSERTAHPETDDIDRASVDFSEELGGGQNEEEARRLGSALPR